MKRMLLLILLSVTWRGCEKQEISLYDDKEDLYGEYLGEPDPGDTPKRFCPQFFSEEMHTPPVFSPDGKEVYWSLMNSEFIDILEMKMEQQKWTKPFTASFNLKKNNDAPYITPDGQRLYFVSADGSSFSNYDENIYYVIREDSDWSFPVPVPDVINDFNLHWEVTVARNYNLYFQNTEDHNIYCSKYLAGDYQVPVKMPETINSPEHLVGSPYISPDETFIIFDRRSSSGNSDLFISLKGLDGYWAEAISLDASVNTSGNEMYPCVTPDGKYLFFLRMTSQGTFPYWMRMTALNELIYPN